MSQTFHELAAASRDWIGDAPTGAMLSAMRAFVSAATQDEAVLRAAASLLAAQESGSVAFLAVAFGTLVERGGSAEITGPAVLDEMLAWLPKLPAPGDGDEPPVPTPDQAMLLARFQFLCQSAVTHLARLPSLRESLGQDAALLDRLDRLCRYSYGACWAREALLKASGTLVLLHPPSGTGLRLRYANVSNCFHLFTLLQTAVGTGIPGGRARVGPVMQGDEAWWHYGSPLSPKADLKASIWGEGLVREVPRVDGEQAMLLWPPILQKREWDAGFLGPQLEAMPASVEVERKLTPDESRAWLQKLGIAGLRKRWWPF